MAKKSLVISHYMTKEMEYSGQFLLKALDKKGVTVNAAIWFFYAEISTWKYILIIDDFEEKGPTFIYNIISNVNRDTLSKKYQAIPLDMVEAKGKSSFIYKVMKSMFHVENGSVRLTNNMINGLEIADCLIYRMR